MTLTVVPKSTPIISLVASLMINVEMCDLWRYGIQAWAPSSLYPMSACNGSGVLEFNWIISLSQLENSQASPAGPSAMRLFTFV